MAAAPAPAAMNQADRHEELRSKSASLLRGFIQVIVHRKSPL